MDSITNYIVQLDKAFFNPHNTCTIRDQVIALGLYNENSDLSKYSLSEVHSNRDGFSSNLMPSRVAEVCKLLLYNSKPHSHNRHTIDYAYFYWDAF